VTSSGYALQPAITIPADAQTITIGNDGAVTVKQAGQTAPTQIGTVQLVTFVNAGGLQSVGENLFLETASSGSPTPNTPGTNGAGLLNQTYLEGANVNVVEEMVNMIQTQRAYEINSRAISVSDQILQRLAQI
jgi:flagellar basal-body rod protein FlgG